MEKITVDLVCPVYKGYKELSYLLSSLKKQQKININKIVIPVTNSNDQEFCDILNYIKDNELITYFIVEKDEFSHSLTRERAIKEYCSSNIVVMMSQDIKLISDDAIFNLVEDIYNKNTVYNYGKQICTNKSIEKYVRAKNYPNTSYIVSKEKVDDMQIMAFFASDAFSAYDRDVFISVGGYGGYDVMMSEDMLYSKIILDHGYKKKYCSNAIVEHSHKYTLKQLYNRYYETGKFYAKVKMFDQYKSTNSGISLAFYILKEAIKHFDIKTLLRWFPDMLARYIGMKNGRKQV